MSIPTCCCKDCTKRVLYCHASCEEYKAYSEKMEAHRAELKKQRDADYGIAFSNHLDEHRSQWWGDNRKKGRT